jgi:hypothetical protein
MYPWQQYTRKNRGTVGNGVFYSGQYRSVGRRTTGARRNSWKRAAIQRGTEHGSRGIAIVGAVTRQLLVKTLRDGKDLAYTLMICEVWKLAIGLHFL